jgi:hypothetical protein
MIWAYINYWFNFIESDTKSRRLSLWVNTSVDFIKYFFEIFHLILSDEKVIVS